MSKRVYVIYMQFEWRSVVILFSFVAEVNAKGAEGKVIH